MTAAASRGVLRLDAADLVATADAGCSLAELDAALAAAGAWLALDPPGPRARTLGQSLGGGAPGPLAALYGPPRDQVIGLAFTAGAGTLVRTGGRVVKNVAGFDLAKLVVGGHGAFGMIAEAHLRLRARPEADATRLWLGDRRAVASAAARLMHAGATPAAFEVMGPGILEQAGPRWTLAVRAMGTGVGATEELEESAAVAGTGLTEVFATEPWAAWADAVGAWATRVRIGADPSRWAEAVDLAAARGATGFSVTVPRGTVRARFGAGAGTAIRALRADAAARGWPVTLEHADDATLRDAGIWGAMPDGSLRLAKQLRAALGPPGTETIPLWTDA